MRRASWASSRARDYSYTPERIAELSANARASSLRSGASSRERLGSWRRPKATSETDCAASAVASRPVGDRLASHPARLTWLVVVGGNVTNAISRYLVAFTGRADELMSSRDLDGHGRRGPSLIRVPISASTCCPCIQKGGFVTASCRPRCRRDPRLRLRHLRVRLFIGRITSLGVTSMGLGADGRSTCGAADRLGR
jgi:hypothetical protein